MNRSGKIKTKLSESLENQREILLSSIFSVSLFSHPLIVSSSFDFRARCFSQRHAFAGRA